MAKSALNSTAAGISARQVFHCRIASQNENKRLDGRDIYLPATVQAGDFPYNAEHVAHGGYRTLKFEYGNEREGEKHVDYGRVQVEYESISGRVISVAWPEGMDEVEFQADIRRLKSLDKVSKLKRFEANIRFGKDLAILLFKSVAGSKRQGRVGIPSSSGQVRVTSEFLEGDGI